MLLVLTQLTADVHSHIAALKQQHVAFMHTRQNVACMYAGLTTSRAVQEQDMQEQQKMHEHGARPNKDGSLEG